MNIKKLIKKLNKNYIGKPKMCPTIWVRWKIRSWEISTHGTSVLANANQLELVRSAGI